MSFLASPRRRRRLAWVVGIVVVVALFLSVNALLPSHGGPVHALPKPGAPAFGQTSAAEERAARRSAAAVQPLANAYVARLMKQRHVAGAGGATVVFSGRSTVGLVASIPGPNDSITLVAIRFDRKNGRWALGFEHEGHETSRVGQSNFSPAGFEPGSRRETVWTWLILGLGLLGLVALAALVDHRLSRPR